MNALAWWSVTMTTTESGAVVASVTVQADDAEAAIEAAQTQAAEHVDVAIDDLTFTPSPLPEPPSE